MIGQNITQGSVIVIIALESQQVLTKDLVNTEAFGTSSTARRT